MAQASDSPTYLVPVSAAMHQGVITAAPQTTLAELAAQMADERIHSVVVEGLAQGPHHTERLVWGLVSDLDVIRTLAADELDVQAGDVAATEIVTIDPQDDIQHAAQLMGEHDCSHLVVISPQSGKPIGVISSLDVIHASRR
jgi:CBS domain-containing protein